MFKIIKIIISSILLVAGISWSNKNNHVPNHTNPSIILDHIKTAYEIKFIPESVFRSTNNDVYLNRHEQLAVDSRGRVYISGAYAINVFDPDGHYVTQLSRKGRGPGEFQSMPEIQVQSGQLYAYDNVLRRINIFSLYPLKFSRDIILTADKWSKIRNLHISEFRQFFILNNGTYLMGFTKLVPSPEYYKFYLADSTGRVIPGQIFKRRYVNLISGAGGPPPPPVSGFQQISSPVLPTSRSSLMAVSGDGHIFSAWTEDFLIKEYAPDGTYLRAINHPYKRVPVDPKEVMNHYRDESARYLTNIRNAIPKTWPALCYMLLDDQNRLWVATIGNSKNHYEWWVLSATGKLLAKFTWPGKRINRLEEPCKIRIIKNGFLYAFKKDNMSDTDEIVKYRIVMKPKSNTSPK